MQIKWKHIFALPDLFQQFRFKIFSEANGKVWCQWPQVNIKHNNYFKSFLANSTGEIERRARFVDNAYFLLV